MAVLAHWDSWQLGPCKDEEGGQKCRASPCSGTLNASPLQKGTRHWAVCSHLSNLAAVGAVLCSTRISMETQPSGLIQVFRLGSSHTVLGLPGSDQRGQQLGQCWMGLQVRVQGGQPSSCTETRPGTSSACQHGKAWGKEPHALGGCPITPLESHRSLALLLPISGTPQHPCLWRHSTVRHAACLWHFPHPLHLPHGKGPATIPG